MDNVIKVAQLIIEESNTELDGIAEGPPDSPDYAYGFYKGRIHAAAQLANVAEHEKEAVS